MCPTWFMLLNLIFLTIYKAMRIHGNNATMIRKCTEITDYRQSTEWLYLQIRTVYTLRLLGKILFVIVLPISGSCQSMVYRSVIILRWDISPRNFTEMASRLHSVVSTSMLSSPSYMHIYTCSWHVSIVWSPCIEKVWKKEFQAFPVNVWLLNGSCCLS